MDPDTIPVGALVRRLTVSQLWTSVGALFGALSVSFALGYSVATIVDQVKYERLAANYDSLELIIQREKEQNQDMEKTLEILEHEVTRLKEQMETRDYRAKMEALELRRQLAALQLVLNLKAQETDIADQSPGSYDAVADESQKRLAIIGNM